MLADKISVIVPAYNLERYIRNTVQSILNQTHTNLEVIIVDDGSSDRTPEILDELTETDPRIKIIHKENGGVTSARLCGVRAATGEWVGFVDGDDYIEPQMYESLLQNAIKYRADISHCGYQLILGDGRTRDFYNTGRLAKQDKLTGLKDLLDGSIIEPGLCNKLFHKNLFHSLLHTDLMDCSIRINEDLLMNFYLFREADLSIFHDICPYHYIKREGSASQQKLSEDKLYDPIRVKEKILEAAPPELLPAARCAYLGTCIVAYNCVIVSRQKELKVFRDEIRERIRKSAADKRQMRRKTKLSIWMIRYVPWLYNPLYRFYSKHLQKGKYS